MQESALLAVLRQEIQRHDFTQDAFRASLPACALDFRLRQPVSFECSEERITRARLKSGARDCKVWLGAFSALANPIPDGAGNPKRENTVRFDHHSIARIRKTLREIRLLLREFRRFVPEALLAAIIVAGLWGIIRAILR
jgi:hypothetical protein